MYLCVANKVDSYRFREYANASNAANVGEGLWEYSGSHILSQHQGMDDTGDASNRRCSGLEIMSP